MLHGFRAGGSGWVSIPGVAAYGFTDAGPVTAVSDGVPRRRARDEVEDAWVRSVLPLVVQARGTQVLHASAVAGRAVRSRCAGSRRRASRRWRQR